MSNPQISCRTYIRKHIRVYIMMIGAAGDEVTGSCILLRIEIGDKVYFGVIDCGIFQGENEARNLKNPITGKNLDFIIISHSHSDHFLGLPLLKEYRGKIYATSSTFAQGKKLAEDAAKNYERNAAEQFGISIENYRKMCIELEDLQKKANHNELSYYHSLKAEVEYMRSYALYTKEDVENISRHFSHLPPYKDVELASGLYARLIPSTHINGSVSIELYAGNYDEESVNIAFSGDIGPNESYLYKEHNYGENRLIKYCVVESTHGIEERKQSAEDVYVELEKVIVKGAKEGKTIILGAFALERLAMEIYSINRIRDKHKLSVPIVLDTPLGYQELLLYDADYKTRKTKNNYWFKELGENPFDLKDIKVTNRRLEHEDILLSNSPKIVITTSAFGEVGRIRDYFARYIQDSNALFIFPCWLKPGCASYKLHNTAEGDVVDIGMGEKYAKWCKTIQYSGWSGHGYLTEYLEFIGRYPDLKGIVLNHGDERSAKEPLKNYLETEFGYKVFAPKMYDELQQNFLMITADSMEEISSNDGFKLFSPVLKD